MVEDKRKLELLKKMREYRQSHQQLMQDIEDLLFQTKTEKDLTRLKELQLKENVYYALIGSIEFEMALLDKGKDTPEVSRVNNIDPSAFSNMLISEMKPR